MTWYPVAVDPFGLACSMPRKLTGQKGEETNQQYSGDIVLDYLVVGSWDCQR